MAPWGGKVSERKVAAALRFDPETDAAPEIVAVGQGHVAETILEVAEAAGVVIYKDPPLARALGQLELGSHIPPELYRAVAEVLVFVYDLDQQSDKAASGLAS